MTTETQDASTVTTDAGGTQTADQTTAADTTQATQTGDASKDTTKADAAVEYEFKVPEGVDLDQASLDEFKTVLKDKTLTDPQRAQKIVDLAAKREVDRANAFAKQVEDWGTQVKADPELGKPENLATAKKTIDTFGTPELRDLLNSTGMGNHPEVIRMALKIGKAISEDTFVAGRTGNTPPPRDAAAVLYGNTPTK